MRSLLLVACLLVYGSSAYAACPSPFTMRDAASSVQNVASINDASNNCVFKSSVTNPDGSDSQMGGCAGQTVANTFTAAINNAGSSANLKLVSKVSAKNIYICSIDIVVGTVVNVALVNGTKTTNECDTSTVGMAGGATAATGWNFATSVGGLTKGNGVGIVFKTTGTNLDVCLLFSAAVQVSGSITYAQF